MMIEQVPIPSKVKVRKHLNADALFSSLKEDFDNIPENRTGGIQVFNQGDRKSVV